MDQAPCNQLPSHFGASEDSQINRRVRAHWLTRKPHADSFYVAAFSVLMLVLATFIFWDGTFDADSWMTAIPQNVFVQHEYWRLWTALFAHADLEHLLSNSVLFFAFAYLLYGYFGSWIFPGAALIFGGLINGIVLATLPGKVNLLGASGVVYWMGAVWLTLYLCLESRDRLSRRIVKALGVGAVLFVPETFHANVSYLSHFIGFTLGAAWGLGYYFWNRQSFLEAEVFEIVSEERLQL